MDLHHEHRRGCTKIFCNWWRGWKKQKSEPGGGAEGVFPPGLVGGWEFVPTLDTAGVLAPTWGLDLLAPGCTLSEAI